MVEAACGNLRGVLFDPAHMTRSAGRFEIAPGLVSAMRELRAFRAVESFVTVVSSHAAPFPEREPIAPTLMRRIGRRLVPPHLAIGLATLVLAACGGGADGKAEAGAAPASAGPKAGGGKAGGQAQSGGGQSSADSLQDDKARELRYAKIADAFEADPKAAISGKTFESYKADLQSIVDKAEDAFLRANAAVLLGHMAELRGDNAGAIAYWRHAAKIVPDDAGPYMVLAVGLAADKQWEEAAKIQAKAAELDPNNLENWLALGELRVRAGDKDGATGAYVDYERVRKSLIDGLTGQRENQYVVSADERAQCALNLAAAVDTGTAFALLYALETEPEAKVRAAVAEVMGIQRLEAYKKRLLERVKTEPDAETKTVMQWALSEIGRDPVTIEKDAAATLPKDDPRAVDGGDPRAGLAAKTDTSAAGVPTDAKADDAKADDAKADDAKADDAKADDAKAPAKTD